MYNPDSPMSADASPYTYAVELECLTYGESPYIPVKSYALAYEMAQQLVPLVQRLNGEAVPSNVVKLWRIDDDMAVLLHRLW